jgi:AbrB family looped-hinge helix DNA binding protein
MRVTSKGQVTIPAEIREQFGFLPDTEITFVVEDDTVKIVKAPVGDQRRGNRLTQRLRGRSDTGMSTDEILALTRTP